MAIGTDQYFFFFFQEKMMVYLTEFCEGEDDEIYHKFIHKITGKPIGLLIKKQ